ncbi:MAG: Holliday junction resolvase [Thermoplasmata archaeon]|nr:MAG: Holliday junction resolvase [Thermoplasmata archaeon]
MAGTFERELKGILQADEKVLERVTKSCSDIEKKNYYSILKNPFIVIRAAGSFGVDLVAVRHDLSFPIEVKASKKKKIHFSDSEKLKLQAEKMLGLCSRAGLVPIYAYRLKNVRGDSWRVYTMNIDRTKLSQKYAKIYAILPKIRTTKSGNRVLDWEDGKPLNEFLLIISE